MDIPKRQRQLLNSLDAETSLSTTDLVRTEIPACWRGRGVGGGGVIANATLSRHHKNGMSRHHHNGISPHHPNGMSHHHQNCLSRHHHGMSRHHQTVDAGWPENVEKCTNISICRLGLVVVSISIQLKVLSLSFFFFFASNLSSSWLSHVGSFSELASWKVSEFFDSLSPSFLYFVSGEVGGVGSFSFPIYDRQTKQVKNVRQTSHS